MPSKSADQQAGQTSRRCVGAAVCRVHVQTPRVSASRVTCGFSVFTRYIDTKIWSPTFDHTFRKKWWHPVVTLIESVECLKIVPFITVVSFFYHRLFLVLNWVKHLFFLFSQNFFVIILQLTSTNIILRFFCRNPGAGRNARCAFRGHVARRKPKMH